MDSSLATLTATSLSHVTEVLSPAFDAGTLFYEVNITSLTYTLDTSACSDAATGLEVDGKAAPAIYTVPSTAPAYQEIRVLVSARDATTTTYVVHAFFQPVVPCDAFHGSCMCDAEGYGSSCNAHCPGSVSCHDREMCDTASVWGCVCNETFGGPGCNVRSCPHCPLHSSCLEGGADRFAPVISLTVGFAGEWLPTGKVAKSDLPLFCGVFVTW